MFLFFYDVHMDLVPYYLSDSSINRIDHTHCTHTTRIYVYMYIYIYIYIYICNIRICILHIHAACLIFDTH